MIYFNNVSMSYPNSTDRALKNVSFSVEAGEFIFLIGRSGSGKSTIIKLISAEERPNAGDLVIDGVNIPSLRRNKIPYLRRNIGMVFQDFRLIPSKTVFENVAFAMKILGASKKQIRRRVSIVLSIVGLKDKEKMKPNELSGGEQQRVAIARAIVNNPMLLVADEPTGNLDPANSESIMAILNEINRNGTTVIVCTHDYHLVNRMKKRVIEIQEGYIVRDDSKGAYCAIPSGYGQARGIQPTTALGPSLGKQEGFAPQAGQQPSTVRQGTESISSIQENSRQTQEVYSKETAEAKEEKQVLGKNEQNFSEGTEQTESNKGAFLKSGDQCTEMKEQPGEKQCTLETKEKAEVGDSEAEAKQPEVKISNEGIRASTLSYIPPKSLFEENWEDKGSFEKFKQEQKERLEAEELERAERG